MSHAYICNLVDNGCWSHCVHKASFFGICRNDTNVCYFLFFTKQNSVYNKPLLNSLRIDRLFFVGQFHFLSLNWCWHSRMLSNEPLTIWFIMVGSYLQMFTCFCRSRFTLLQIRFGSTMSSLLRNLCQKMNGKQVSQQWLQLRYVILLQFRLVAFWVVPSKKNHNCQTQKNVMLISASGPRPRTNGSPCVVFCLFN